VRGLILARPAWIAASAPANNIPNALVGRLLAELSQEDARNAFEASEIARLLAEKAPDNLASLRGFFSREPQATTAALLQAIATDGPGVSEEDLRNLEIPTLIIGHDIDYIHPLSYAAAISQLIPRSQLVSVTPKAVSKAAYLKDFHTAITNFLETFLWCHNLRRLLEEAKFIASGFYGAAAFQKGIPGALVGLLAHFFIAFAVAAIYVGATRFLPMLSREAVMWGTIYGAAVFIVMNFVVLPHTAVVKSPLSLPLLLNGVLGHALFVGLPIALAARRITNQSSFSTQAA
jgi:hypothetical protein